MVAQSTSINAATTIAFNGGTVFCTGGQQGTYLWNGSAKVGWFTIADDSDKVVMSSYIPRAISTNCSLISAPLTSGAKYKYGIMTSAPSGAASIFGDYFHDSGTTSSLSSSFTAGTGYNTL